MVSLFFILPESIKETNKLKSMKKWNSNDLLIEYSLCIHVDLEYTYVPKDTE